ncbi:MAG: type II secretion system protein [Planctomycetes bacterium]|nr:type II secretion system protein [Planctomycetota bacterium]
MGAIHPRTSGHGSTDQMSQRRDAGRCAFTLIELLVSITIIAVLIGLLIPMVMKGRIYANRTVCMSNMRQIGMMTMQYCDNNEGSFPAYYPNNPSDVGSLYGATDQLQAYLPESGYRVYLCPSSIGKPVCSNDTDPNAILGGAYALSGGRLACSYGWNEHLRAARPGLDWWNTGPGGNSAAAPINYNVISNPSKTFWIADATSARFDRTSWGRRFAAAHRHGGAAPQQTGSWPFPELDSKPGAQGFNALFADGHGQWLKYHGDFREWSLTWWVGEQYAWQ